MNWEEILKQIGFVGIIAGFITWLVKELGQSYLNKNLESYKLNLNQKSEQFKKDLELIAQKANKLHEKRIDRIEQIYSLLTDFHNDMQNLTSWKIITGKSDDQIKQDEIDNVNKANESGSKFFDYYSKNKLYFNTETCEIIDNIQKILRSSHLDFSFKYMFNLSPEMSFKNIQSATEKIREQVPILKIELENNFRKIIGVE